VEWDPYDGAELLRDEAYPQAWVATTPGMDYDLHIDPALSYLTQPPRPTPSPRRWKNRSGGSYTIPATSAQPFAGATSMSLHLDGDVVEP